MTFVRLLPLCLACLIGNAHADTSLDIATQLARGGAHQLAYQRVERSQPLSATAEWAQWEALRLHLLVELKREQEALQRVAQFPQGLPPSAAALYLPAARAALKQNDAALARLYAAKFLWGSQPGESNGDSDTALISALESLINETARALNADRATLFFNDEKTNELWSKFGVGLEGRQIRLPNHAGIAGAVFSSGKPLNIPDAYADPRFNPASDRETGYFTRSILCVPVIAQSGKILGVVQALNKRGGPFGAADETRLRAAALQTVQVLENAGVAQKNGTSRKNGGADFREARRLVIRSYLAERRPDTAYLAMLRYRQDYSPLPAEEIAAFGEQLLLTDGVTEAAHWLTQLDENHPLNLLVRLRSGLISAETAASAARLIVEPPPTPAPPPPDKNSRKPVKAAPPAPPAKPGAKELAGYWAIIGMAGEQLKSPALQAESLERRLNAANLAEDGLYGARAVALWRQYEELGLATANRAHLLIGEDNRWLELAVNSASSSPLTARALFAFLAQRGNSAEMRHAGKTRLAAMLIQKNLDIAAARLFDGDPSAEALLLEHLPATEKARRAALFTALGQAAAARGEHLPAAEYFLRANTTRGRKLAAENLARAGLTDDAQRLYNGQDKP